MVYQKYQGDESLKMSVKYSRPFLSCLWPLCQDVENSSYENVFAFYANQTQFFRFARKTRFETLRHKETRKKSIVF